MVKKHHKIIKTPIKSSRSTYLFIFLLFILLIITIWATKQIQQYISKGYSRSTDDNIIKTLSNSTSKLGIFIINSTDGAKKIIDRGPRVIKVMDPQGNSSVLNAMRDYKSKYPDGIVVVRIYEGGAPSFGYNNDPEVSASEYWQKFLGPEIHKLNPSDQKLITYLSGPNEYGNTPIIKTPEDAAWTGKFWVTLAELISTNGFRPIMGEIPVGNLDESHIAQLVPALRKIKELGGAWSYHAYSLDYSTDPDVEIWYSLRYRRFYDYLKTNASDIADIPMILTEGGIDKTGNGKTDGWNGTIPPRGDQNKFTDWLQWYDTEIKKDPYILGVTLFQIGNNSDWSSFDIEPVSNWLSNYLAGQPEERRIVNTPTLSPQPTPTTYLIPTIYISPTIPVSTPILPSITSQLLQPTNTIIPPSNIPQPSTFIYYSPTPIPTTTPIPPTPTPKPIIDIKKTAYDTQVFIKRIIISVVQFARIILP